MIPDSGTLDTIGHDLDEARSKIEVTRDALQGVLSRGIDVAEFHQAVARLERIEEEMARMEGVIARQ